MSQAVAISGLFFCPLLWNCVRLGKPRCWSGTPAYPDGRSMRIVLAAITCDRPVAIAATGAPHFGNVEDICTRCEAKKGSWWKMEGRPPHISAFPLIHRLHDDSSALPV